MQNHLIYTWLHFKIQIMFNHILEIETSHMQILQGYNSAPCISWIYCD